MRFRLFLLLVLCALVAHALLAAQGFVVDANTVQELNGLWQFYPGELLTGFDLSLAEIAPTAQAQGVQVPVPADWNRYMLPDGKKFGSFGAGSFTVWLENLQAGELYAIRLNYAGSAHAIYIGDEAQPLCSMGKVALRGEEHAPDYRHVLCRFTATAARLRLTIQVANFLHAAGGLRDAPLIGKEQLIWRGYLLETTAIIAVLAFLLGGSVLLVLGMLIDRQNVRNLYLLGLTLSMVIYALGWRIRLGREISEFYGFFAQARLNMWLLPFGSAMLWFYAASWLNEGRLRRMVRMLGWVVIGYAAMILLLPFSFVAQFYYPNLTLTALFAAGYPLLLLYAGLRQKTHDWIIQLGSVTLLITVMLAILRVVYHIKLPAIELIGILFFVVSQTAQSVVEIARIRRLQQVAAQENRLALARLGLFVPLVHLARISRYGKDRIAPGKYYRTEACIMFLRIEPAREAQLEEEVLLQLYADFSEEVANYVQRVGGVVDRIAMGRFILSFNEDPAVALQLAVQLRTHVRQWGELLSSYLLFRCGIHYGPAVWGLYGSEDRWAGGYMGDTINTAARLETLCARYRSAILMSQDAYFQSAHLDEYVTRMLEPVKLKGKEEHTFVYEVLSGLPEDRQAIIRDTLPAFGRGLQAFLNRDFSTAISFFEKVVAANPKDFAAQIYLKRATRLIEQGTDESWNPIEALQKK